MRAPSPRPLTFADGVGLGLGVLAALPLVYFAITAGAWKTMYRDMVDRAALPMLTRVVLHPAWPIVVPGVVFSLWALVLVRRPALRYAMVWIAVLTIAADVISYWGVYMPIFQIAGNVQ